MSEPDVAGAELTGADDRGTASCCCACEGPEPGGKCTANDGEFEWPEEVRIGGHQRVEEDEGIDVEEELIVL